MVTGRSPGRASRLSLPRLVVDIIRQCNLSCRGCNHFAPYGNAHAVTPEDLARDLGMAEPYLHVADLRISGGETLLHPSLIDVLRVARDSGVGDRVTLLTNGLLLDRMPEDLWRSLDCVQISLYPAAKGRVDLESAQQRARETDTELWVHRPEFREPAADLPAKDTSLARRIFVTCLFRRACLTLREGRLYPCPQSAWAHERWPQAAGADPVNATDGLLLEDRPDMADRIRAHLARREPLGSCARCLGIVGQCIGHSQLPIEQARRAEPRSVEDLLDAAELQTRLGLMRLNRRLRFIPRWVRRPLGLLPTSRSLAGDMEAADAKERLWPPARRGRRRAAGQAPPGRHLQPD